MQQYMTVGSDPRGCVRLYTLRWHLVTNKLTKLLLEAMVVKDFQSQDVQ